VWLCSDPVVVLSSVCVFVCCVFCVCKCVCAVIRPPEKLYPIYVEDNPVKNFTSLLLFSVSGVIK